MKESLFSYLFFIFTAPLILGIINKVKAFWAGRQGVSLFQSFFDMHKLLQKSEVVSHSATFIFKISPTISLAATLCAAMFVPFAGKKAFFHFEGDFILFIYLLGLSRFFAIIGALDTGSSFEGMGASREAFFSALMEPAIFIILGFLAMTTGIKSFSDIPFIIPSPQIIGEQGIWEHILWIKKIWWRTGLLIPVVSGGIVLFFMILVEAGRMPVDDPNTHLELTMIHEVMILDNSGPDLAMIQYSRALKIVIYSVLIGILLIPGWFPLFIGFSLSFIIVVLVAIMIGLIESAMARLRMTHVPQFIFGALSIALLVLLVLEVLLIRDMT